MSGLLGTLVFRAFICCVKSLLALRPQCWRDHVERERPWRDPQASAHVAFSQGAIAAKIRYVSTENDSFEVSPASAAI